MTSADRKAVPTDRVDGLADRDADRDAYDDAQMILGVALGGDHVAVVASLDAVVGRDGLSGAYDVALCLAATMIGDDVHGGEASYDARWVARFVSAYANADRPTGEALLSAAEADGQLGACLAMLAGSTVETLRRRVV
jgi:hypothetical protein